MAKLTFSLSLLLACGAVQAPAQKPRPEWLGKEPLVIIGNWDSMPIFRLRVGGAAPSMEDEYARQHTDEAVRKLKELGVTMGVIHFYKGFGLAAEAEHMADARKLAALLRQNGLRVGVYVGSTIGYETFLAEKPEAQEWFVPDYLGRPVIYSNHSFRKRVYFMHPGYRAYIKRVLEIALKDLKADLIHFDNTSMQAQAPIFHHPMAVRDFREYLAHKYTPAHRTARFGFAEVRFVEPPVVDRAVGAIDDPIWQDWADFRCAQLTAYYAEMEQYIRSLNPQAAVESNPHSGISGHNTVWEQGVDYPQLLSHMDVVWTEEGNQARSTPEGLLISKIRTYKMAETLGNRIFTYTGGGRGGKLQMAEAMAFNRQTLGQVGDGLAGYSFPDDQRAYVKFFHDHFEDIYRGVHSRPDVAVLHSYASMAYNNDQPWESSTLVEQALIQANVPFTIVFDAQLADLKKFRTLILPDQECLSNAQIELVRKYVEGGGGLVATGQTSLFDTSRRRRENFGLRDLFGVDAARFRDEIYSFRPFPAVIPGAAVAAGTTAAPVKADAAPVRRTPGNGRSSYIASVRPEAAKPSGAFMTSQYWKLPLNSGQIVDEVTWAARELSLQVKGPAGLVVEPLEQEGTGRLPVHLLNYDDARGAAENVEVGLKLPDGRTVAAVRLLSPDGGPAATLHYTVMAGSVVFRVPAVRTYSVALVNLK